MSRDSTNNKCSLKAIAQVQTGIYCKAAPEGRVLYLQAKHFDEQGRMKNEEALVPEVLPERKVERHLLQDKDLLLIAKGNHNQACMYRASWGPAVGSTVFFIIRLQAKEVLPEYLQWYLNSRQVQKALAGQYRGTSIPSIPKQVLTEMQIPVPTLAAQQKILDFHQLWEQERNLMQQLLREKEYFYESLMFQQLL